MAALVRVQKVLADAGLASRRQADALVAAGRVTVNGAVASVGQRIDPESDRLAVDGRPVAGRPRSVYLLINKPAGVTSTVSDRHAQRTVIDLVPADLRREARRLYPVGRLDRDSKGLLLLTNDGDWAQLMLHPSHAIEREYAVGVDVPLTADQQRRLVAGVELEEGMAAADLLRPATAAEARSVAASVGRPFDQLAWYRAVIHQGWKRQLRRMFSAVGSLVEELVRVRFGTLRLSGMRSGDVRELTARERHQLEALAIARTRQ